MRLPFSLTDAIPVCRQEPGTNDEIKEFVKKFNVTFPLFDKVNVNGPQAHPLFKWLKDEYVARRRPRHAHCSSCIGLTSPSLFVCPSARVYTLCRLPGSLGIKGVKWNFTKFLINKQGKPVQRYGPPTDPKSIEKDILTLMEKDSL